jgi:heat shock protein HtpX
VISGLAPKDSETANEPVKRVEIGENVPVAALKGLASFMETYYLTPNLRYFRPAEFRQTGSESGQSFGFDWTLDLTRIKEPIIAFPPTVDVHLSLTTSGTTVEFRYGSSIPGVDQVCAHVADDIEAVIAAYLGNAKRTSLHFVFSLGKEERMEAPSQTETSLRREVIKRVFAGNTVNLYLILMMLTFVFIILLGNYALIALLAVQALALFFSDRVVMGAGAVRPTKAQPEVTIVTVMLTPEAIRSLSGRGSQVMSQIKDQLEKTVFTGNVDDPETKAAIHNILFQANVNCSIEDIEVKTRDPYSLVEMAAQRFHLPIPKIIVVSTPVDNAAATGISPRRSSMTIMAGALEDLDDDELEAIIGHELGHIRGRDPIVLFCVASVMYLGGLYLWLPLLRELGLFYFILAFAVVYLVGKFLETRADTASVAVLGKPNELASALTQIGFRQLYYEKYSPRARLLDWFRFDPHPPMYFRVKRLSKIAATGGEIKHTLRLSIRDIVIGFLAALAGRA